MATILAMVNAEKEGQIESKLMKARQLEEIREARKKEAEARQAQKKSKLVRIHGAPPNCIAVQWTNTMTTGGCQKVDPPETEAQGRF